jgi:hypothetical protein
MQPFKTDKDIRTFDLKEIATHVQTKGAAIFHEQDFKEQDFINTMKQFGQCEAPDLFIT